MWHDCCARFRSWCHGKLGSYHLQIRLHSFWSRKILSSYQGKFYYWNFLVNCIFSAILQILQIFMHLKSEQNCSPFAVWYYPFLYLCNVIQRCHIKRIQLFSWGHIPEFQPYLSIRNRNKMSLHVQIFSYLSL